MQYFETFEPRRLCAATVSVTAAAAFPHPDHVVEVIMENEPYSRITKSVAPFINSVADHGAKFDQSFATDHPSQPNYLVIVSDSNQGVHDDNHPKKAPFSTSNIGAQLIGAGN